MVLKDDNLNLIVFFNQIDNSYPAMTNIFSDPNFKIYLVYCLAFLILGMIITGLGPLIPYLAFYEGRTQLAYSFLFIYRAIGYIVGSIIIKFTENRLNLHKILMIAFLLSGFTIPFSLMVNMNMKGLFMFLASIGGSFIDIGVNLCIIKLFEKKNMNAWLQICHGAFGIGGLLGPYAVYLFQVKTFIVFGIVSLLTIPFYYFEPSPEEKQEEKINDSLLDKEEKKHSMKSYHIILISLMYLFMVGQESTYGGWIPTYAVMNQFASKEGATKYSSIYWVSATIFRFILPFTKGKSSTKLFTLYIIAIASGFGSLFIIHGMNPSIGMIISSFLLGLSNSILFPQTLTLASQYNYEITVSANSNFMLAASIGDGTLALFVGLAMYITPDMLFYGIILMNVLCLLLLKMTVEDFKKCNQILEEEKVRTEEIEMQKRG